MLAYYPTRFFLPLISFPSSISLALRIFSLNDISQAKNLIMRIPWINYMDDET